MNGLSIEIKNISGKWLINGKQYRDCNSLVQSFFDEFIKEMNYGDNNDH